MKIEDLLLLPVNPASSPTSRGGQDNFAEFLKEALALKETEAGPQALGGPDLMAGLAPVESDGGAQEMVETVLSRLEIFQEALARPGLTPKGLSPLVQALEKDSERLESLAQALPKDSSLRQVAEEAAALTWTESFKFKRGDYV